MTWLFSLLTLVLFLPLKPLSLEWENRATRQDLQLEVNVDGVGGTAILGNLREVIGQFMFLDDEKMIAIGFDQS